ncbi:MAG TPA: hypothetical protein VI584_09270 [Nitrospiria bacterium]|nr:hypothetical protein [Nitrospiria bacterium]
MRWTRRSLILLLFLPFFIVTLFLIQQEIDIKRDSNRQVERFMFLPKGEYLKAAALGYDQLVADIVWLQAIQVLGEKRISAEGYDWIYHALDVITTLDPKFDYAYQVGGVVLATLGKKIDLSNALLEKGLKENPDVWQIPFYLGFNHFFYMDNYKKAAEFMTIAARLPGRPFYIPQLAATLYVEEGSPEVALEFLERAYKETEDERIKKEIENKTREVMVARDIIFLEGGVKRYIEIYKKNPETLEDLVTGRIINMIPKEPFGGYYYIDKETDEIKSSMKKERMRLHGKPKER